MQIQFALFISLALSASPMAGAYVQVASNLAHSQAADGATRAKVEDVVVTARLA